MDSAAIPYKFAYVWGEAASSGYITATIPTTASGAAASQQQGFPQITAANPGAGGIPPSIADFNGACNYFSSWAQWVQAGGPVGYDGTFSTAIGGYPNNSIIAAAVGNGKRWLSIVDNNTSDPDTGGANWVSFTPGLHGYLATTSSQSFTVPAGVFAIHRRGWGGGGGSGGCWSSPSASSGGGGGAYFEDVIAVTPGQVLTLDVGAAGAPGLANSGSPTNGTAGGTTSISGSGITTASATGGGGGPAANGTIQETVATGGTASGAAFMVNGGGAISATQISGDLIIVSYGGLAFSGGVNAGGAASAPLQGVPGYTPGMGAGGSANSANGAVGAVGQIILVW